MSIQKNIAKEWKLLYEARDGVWILSDSFILREKIMWVVSAEKLTRDMSL